MASLRLMSTQSTASVKPGRKRGRRMAPTVQESAFSLVRSGLPCNVPRAVKSTILDWKSGGKPSAAQFAARVAGLGPVLTKRESHGSSAVVKIWLVGLKISVIAGARTDRV